jgi:uncharacterized membrane protein YozB (DUF420 family)
MIPLSALPALNAFLNATAGLLLLAGYVLIRRRRITAHKWTMIAAFGVSGLFLISYLVYHANEGSTPFAGQGWPRPVYFTILISHILLAATIVPLALITLVRGLRRRDRNHRRIARRTLPLWLYVSATGVLIYFMLYHWFAAPQAGG